MRLQKLLAQAGLVSRRQAEDWIQAGRVAVNGKIVTALGTQADPRVDRIAVDGKLIRSLAPKAYYLLNKPGGYVSTCEDDRRRPTVIDLIKPLKVRLFPVGRLDWDTEGVLLLTNDGELTQRLLHPRYRIRRTYLAKVEGIPTVPILQHLVRVGGSDEPKGSRPRVRLARAGERHAWLEICLWEGKNHQVRRMCEAVGHPVKRLRRVEFAGLAVEGLAPGRYRSLTADEILALQRLTGLDQGHPPSHRAL
jgi:pseudouridine synthase